MDCTDAGQPANGARQRFGRRNAEPAAGITVESSAENPKSAEGTNGEPVLWGSRSTLPAARAGNSDCGENDDKNSRKYAQTITGYHFAFGPTRKHF